MAVEGAASLPGIRIVDVAVRFGLSATALERHVALVGFAVLLIGVILSIGGMLFFNQVYSCLGSLGTACPADVDARFAWAFPLVIFGGYLILLGGFVTISGYVVSAVKSKT